MFILDIEIEDDNESRDTIQEIDDVLETDDDDSDILDGKTLEHTFAFILLYWRNNFVCINRNISKWQVIRNRRKYLAK